MANQNAQWVNIDEIVAAYLDESEQPIHKQFKCTQLAIRIARQLGLHSFSQVKSVLLPINSNMTCSLPDDFGQYAKVGVFNSIGEVATLRYNSNLSLYGNQLPDRLTKTAGEGVNTVFSQFNTFYSNFWYNGSWCNLYGIPGNAYTGTFNIDTTTNTLVLAPNFNYPFIVLEYISHAASNGNYEVPFQFYEAMIAGIRWLDIMSLPSTRKGSISDKEQRKMDFYNQRRLAIAAYRPFRIDEAYELFLENQRMCVKS